MCSLRDAYEAIIRTDAIVIGVSKDSVDSHLRFKESWSLPFHLASDQEGRVMRMYDVLRRWGLGTSRITYLIDKAGIIRDAYHHEVRIGRHVSDVLKGLDELT